MAVGRLKALALGHINLFQAGLVSASPLLRVQRTHALWCGGQGIRGEPDLRYQRYIDAPWADAEMDEFEFDRWFLLVYTVYTVAALVGLYWVGDGHRHRGCSKSKGALWPRGGDQ